MPLSGVLPIVHTPFAADDRIDLPSLRREIDWAFSVGAGGLGSGMVSEILRLTADERTQLHESMVEFSAGRGPVFAAVSAEGIQQALAYAATAQRIGCDAVMAAPPGMTRLSPAGLLDYYRALADGVDVPVIVQDASGYVGQPIPLAVSVELLERYGEDKILFKPEGSPIGPNLSALRNATGGKAKIFEGSGGILLVDSFRRGIVGTMPGMDLLEGIVALWHALGRGDDEAIYRISLPIGAIVALQMQAGLDGFLAIEKYLLVKLGLIASDRRRRPYSWDLDEETAREVDRLFTRMQNAAMSTPLPSGERGAARDHFMRYRILALLCLLAAIAYVQRAAISVPAAAIASDLAFADLARDMGYVQAAWYLGYAVLQLPSGALADRFGSRRAIAGFCVLWSAFTLVSGASLGFWSLVVLWGCMGAAQAGVFPSAAKAIGQFFPTEQRARASGILASGMMIGGALAPILSAWTLRGLADPAFVLGIFPWRLLFVVLAVPGFLWVMFFLDAVPEAPAPIERARAPGVDWRRLLTSVPLALLCAQQFFRAAAMVFFLTWFPTFLQMTRGVSQFHSGVLTTIAGVGGVIGSLTGGFASDALLRLTGNRRLSRQGIAVAGMASCSALITASYYIDDPNWSIAVIALGVFCATFGGVSGYTVAIDYGGRQVATVFSTMNMCGNVGAMLFPVTAGWLVTWTDNWNLILFFFAAIMAVDAGCWALLNPQGTLFGDTDDPSDLTAIARSRDDRSL